MARIPSIGVLAVLAVLAVSATLRAQAPAQVPPVGGQLGTVRFATSCSGAAQSRFNLAVALLHSFEFSDAIAGFGETLHADSTCAMAEWGIALAQWGNPMAPGNRPAAQLQRGRDAVARARAIGPRTERERGYVDAVSTLYDAVETTPQGARVAAYRDAMGALAARFPSDTEATIFHAIAITAAASPNDKSYADQLKAGAILERLVAKMPDHPGLAHYIIHTYDVPLLASRAVTAAERYSTIAPSAPHALHMPSHTFTRVGYWQESIDANVASAAAARRAGATAEELHASDYQAYAFLQTGQDAAARRLLDALPEIERRFDPEAIGGAAPGSAGVFALAAIPARYALERGAWREAAALTPRTTRFSYADAMTQFARALGAARSGDTIVARASVDALRKLQQRLVQANEPYWSEQVRIQTVGASAWLAMATGHTADAIATMRAAADAEDRTEKSAVTPGPLAPARELLGEMLLQTNDPGRALVEFRATLTREPNRFRSLYGAAVAARRSGDTAAARNYEDQILKSCARADRPGRTELEALRRASSGD